MTSNKRPRGDKQPLNELWEELNPKPILPLLEVVKDNVYNRIEISMRRKERKCIIPLNELYYVDDITYWLVETHKLNVKVENIDRGYNPSTHDSFIVKCLVVSW